MATFGRTKLMAVAIKRFLTQLSGTTASLHRAARRLPRRYTPAESQLFADAKDADARARTVSKPPKISIRHHRFAD